MCMNFVMFSTIEKYRSVHCKTTPMSVLNRLFRFEETAGPNLKGQAPSVPGELEAFFFWSRFSSKEHKKFWFGSSVRAKCLNIFQRPFLYDEGCRCISPR